jgi:glycosyltransferase involved in cell wall biosynthesis
MQVVCLTKRWQHHTASGGYDRLARELNCVEVSRAKDEGQAHRVIHHFWRKRKQSTDHLLDYNYVDWVAEWKLLAKANFKRPDLVHVLYGDEQLDLLLRRRQLLRCPLIATFHVLTTREIVKTRFERVQKHLIKGIDLAIVVARSQLADFQRWLGPGRVVYIPHGIDTKRFCPGRRANNAQAVRLVVVGETLRDFDAIHRIIDGCWNMRLPVEFDVVVREKCFPYFAGCTNVRLHAGISEEELITLYRTADALLLPVLDATANNAVLESMACGTPVISSRVGGIPDYVDETAGWLFPKHDVKEIVALIESGCNNREVFTSRRWGARAKSLEFDWGQITEQLCGVYDLVLKGLPVDARNNVNSCQSMAGLELHNA